jgi:glutathione S-transferase
LNFIRHKERKFGTGCLIRWREQQRALLSELSRVLLPFDQMLLTRSFLLCDRPLFVDFDLYGMIENYLYTGHYRFPAAHPRLHAWFKRMQRIKRAVPK